MRTLMREACHRGLYVLVKSSAMNGVGPDTQISRIVFCPFICRLSWQLSSGVNPLTARSAGTVTAKNGLLTTKTHIPTYKRDMFT